MLWLAGLLLALALVAAACGGSETGQQQEEGSTSTAQREGSRAGAESVSPGETTSVRGSGDMGDMEGMDHDSTSMGAGDPEELARRMVTPNGKYSDAAFIDAMVPHHEGAVEMARVSLENAEHEEIRNLSRDVISDQQDEIEMFGEIRDDVQGPTMDMVSDEEMNEAMGMMDAGELARQRPFDRAFIDAMIPHHESAIAMAEVVLAESENPEIREIAGNIVASQEREIEQMRAWSEEWYPEG
jgi:uncharacterized protein (DUF305 family)